MLRETYYQQLRVQLKQQLELDNIFAVPMLSKITLNMGVGEALRDKKVLENAVKDMEMIAGQKPVITKSRISVASFKLRDGWNIGCKVTLRRERMWDFVDRLVHIALPRVRDFRGLNLKSFDGFGNYNIGVREQIIFPELTTIASIKFAG